MKAIHTLIVFLSFTLLMSCGSSKSISKSKPAPIPKAVVVKPKNKKVQKEVKKLVKDKDKLDYRTVAYISKYAEIAMEEMRKYKIPASITLAQGILESGNGVSQLALKSNNHFGVKCHKGWKGDYVRHDDDEDQECFRKYKKVETSYRDHSEFLTTRSRYAPLFKLKRDDYEGWAYGLREAGYATDKRYPQKLIRSIKRYKLYNYDKIVLRKKIKEPKVKKSKYKTHKVRKGDTLYSISKKYKTTVVNLKRLNDLKNNNIGIGELLRVK